ncbi:hypothetical protein L3Q82_006272 [Scortum barcoo]|uniref:Uncharacterized protein n=1 Tax=Scortum barcoo TaxID=214431 RepID=A0ACB8X4I4_9TELE|nr:hypothetical protein L3Q82_006272 [Scortum barcoo]
MMRHHYREEIQHHSVVLTNNTVLNTSKTKEVIQDYRRSRRTEHAPLLIHGEAVEHVNNIKFLGIHITSDLTWSMNTAHLVKKAQQRLFFLRKLKCACWTLPSAPDKLLQGHNREHPLPQCSTAQDQKDLAWVVKNGTGDCGKSSSRPGLNIHWPDVEGLTYCHMPTLPTQEMLNDMIVFDFYFLLINNFLKYGDKRANLLHLDLVGNSPSEESEERDKEPRTLTYPRIHRQSAGHGCQAYGCWCPYGLHQPGSVPAVLPPLPHEPQSGAKGASSPSLSCCRSPRPPPSMNWCPTMRPTRLKLSYTYEPSSSLVIMEWNHTEPPIGVRIVDYLISQEKLQQQEKLHFNNNAYIMLHYPCITYTQSVDL